MMIRRINSVIYYLLEKTTASARPIGKVLSAKSYVFSCSVTLRRIVITLPSNQPLVASGATNTTDRAGLRPSRIFRHAYRESCYACWKLMTLSS
ncbi:hypothetical protein PUN28_019646 [Cardiocondyla obscurior]|uniref:Uncharacterized protein n=1 Tax=Cardiocondyla obscurior TaxID=286306 RepID=A0AAW2EDJ7_9HYME